MAAPVEIAPRAWGDKLLNALGVDIVGHKIDIAVNGGDAKPLYRVCRIYEGEGGQNQLPRAINPSQGRYQSYQTRQGAAPSFQSCSNSRLSLIVSIHCQK